MDKNGQKWTRTDNIGQNQANGEGIMNLNDLNITPDILNLVVEISEFKEQWTYKEKPSRAVAQVLLKVATIESVGASTRIEGSRLSNDDVSHLIANLDEQHFETRDQQEVAGCAEVLDLVLHNYADLTLTENHIKQLHRDLLIHSDKDGYHRGEYKKLANNVQAFDQSGKSLGVVLEATSPFETPIAMQNLIKWTVENLDDGYLHPLLVIGIFIVEFLAIHPFQDGNGRLSRILTTLLLLRAGYDFVQFASLDSVFEQHKEGYYNALRNTQTTLNTEKANWLPWLRYFLIALRRQKDHLIAKVTELLEKSDGKLPKDCRAILEFVKLNRQISLAEAQQLLNIPKSTVRNRLAKLLTTGHLVLRGKGRGTYYIMNR